MKNTIRVRATRNFIVGPYQDIAVAVGSKRLVTPDDEGRFTTKTDDGHIFGVCQLGRGWVVENAS